MSKIEQDFLHFYRNDVLRITEFQWSYGISKNFKGMSAKKQLEWNEWAKLAEVILDTLNDIPRLTDLAAKIHTLEYKLQSLYRGHPVLAKGFQWADFFGFPKYLLNVDFDEGATVTLVVFAGQDLSPYTNKGALVLNALPKTTSPFPFDQTKIEMHIGVNIVNCLVESFFAHCKVNVYIHQDLPTKLFGVTLGRDLLSMDSKFPGELGSNENRRFAYFENFEKIKF
jgi:hypothetical protein